MIIDPKVSRQTEYHESHAVLINTHQPNSLGQPYQLQASLSTRGFRQARISMLVCGVFLLSHITVVSASWMSCVGRWRHRYLMITATSGPNGISASEIWGMHIYDKRDSIIEPSWLVQLAKLYTRKLPTRVPRGGWPRVCLDLIGGGADDLERNKSVLNVACLDPG